MGTGFMKWVLMTLEAALRSVGLLGGVVAAAILVIEIDEVFVERMAWAGEICASCLKMEVFKEGISGTASIMKSESDRSSILVVGERRERAESASDCEILCLETSLARSLSAIHKVRQCPSLLQSLMYLRIACPYPVTPGKYRPASRAL